MKPRDGTLPGQGETGGRTPRPPPRERTLLTGPPGGMVLATEHYDDDQIAQWDTADRLDDSERRRIREAVTGQRRPSGS